MLVRNQGRVFSINQIYENIWNEDAIGADNTVAVHIRHIREKIEINPREPRYLKVVWEWAIRLRSRIHDLCFFVLSEVQILVVCSMRWELR